MSQKSLLNFFHADENARSADVVITENESSRLGDPVASSSIDGDSLQSDGENLAQTVVEKLRMEVEDCPTATGAADHTLPQPKRAFLEVDKSPQQPTNLDIMMIIQSEFSLLHSTQAAHHTRVEAMGVRLDILEGVINSPTSLPMTNAGRIGEVERVLKGVSSSSTDLVDALQRLERQPDIAIRGLTLNRTAGQVLLRDVVTRAARAIGYELTTRDIHYVRVQEWRKSPAIIIAKFSTVALRDMIFADYLRKNIRLNARQLGCDGDGPVFLSDNLTPHATRVRYEARRLKSLGVVNKVSVRRGQIAVSLASEPNKIITVKNLDALAELTRQTPT